MMLEEGGHRPWPGMIHYTTREDPTTTSISRQKNSHTYHLLNCYKHVLNPVGCSGSSLGFLSTPDANPTERVVACDLVYSQGVRMAKEPSSDQSEEVVADIKAVSARLGLRPSAVRTAYKALAKRGAVRIHERIPPKPRHELTLPLDPGTGADTSRKYTQYCR